MLPRRHCLKKKNKTKRPFSCEMASRLESAASGLGVASSLLQVRCQSVQSAQASGGRSCCFFSSTSCTFVLCLQVVVRNVFRVLVKAWLFDEGRRFEAHGANSHREPWTHCRWIPALRWRQCQELPCEASEHTFELVNIHSNCLLILLCVCLMSQVSECVHVALSGAISSFAKV